MGQNYGKLEKLDAESTVNYGATVIYGGDESLTVAPYWFTVGACKTSGHRKLRCHRNLRWRSG